MTGLSETTTGTIYIESRYYSPFLSAWGAVIDQQGQVRELSGQSDTDNAPRLLLVGCIEAIRNLPTNSPVKIVSSVEYLPRWTVSRLSALADDDFKAAKKAKKVNLDLIRELHLLLKDRPGVEGITTSKATWTEHHKRADSLALVEDGVGFQAEATSKPKKTRARPLRGIIEPIEELAKVWIDVDTSSSSGAPWE